MKSGYNKYSDSAARIGFSIELAERVKFSIKLDILQAARAINGNLVGKMYVLFLQFKHLLI